MAEDVNKIEKNIYDGMRIKLNQNRPVVQQQNAENFEQISYAKGRENTIKNNSGKTSENYKTISFVKGKGNLNHDNRVFIAKNVDAERTKNNVIIKQEKLEDAYQKCFGDAIADYNKTQSRNYLKKSLDKYMEEIKKNSSSQGGEQLFYEQLIQVGDMINSNVKNNPEEAEKCKEILKEYAENFQKRNPNLYVFNAVIHMDEQTPHLHLDFIPVAQQGYKQGLKVRNSLNRALKEQGIEKGLDNKKSNEFVNWRKKEVAELEKICEKHQIKVKALHSEKRGYLTPDQYREIGRLADKQVEQLKKEGKLITAEEVQQKIKEEVSKIQGQASKQAEINVPPDKKQEIKNNISEPDEKNVVVHEQQPNKFELQKQYNKTNEELDKKEQLLSIRKEKMQLLIKKAKKAGKDKWFFQNEKAVVNSYLKDNGYIRLKKGILQLTAEIEEIKAVAAKLEAKIWEKTDKDVVSLTSEQQSDQKNLVANNEQQQKPKPKAKLVKSEWQKQREQARNTGRGGMSR